MPIAETSAVLSPLTEYKNYVRQIVGSYWYPAVVRLPMPAGRIHVRFTIHSDGTITDARVVEGKDRPLASIAIDSLKAPSPFKPFDESLIDQVGEKYTDDLWFTNLP